MSRDPEHHKPDKENLEHEKEGILDRDKFIGDLASTIGDITESTYGGVVDRVIMDFNIVDDIRNHLVEDREYRPSDEDIARNPRIGEVWKQIEHMRNAITDPQSSDQAEGYRSILDDLASRAKDIVSSRRDADAKAAKDAAEFAASIGIPAPAPARFAPPSTASHPYSQPDILAAAPGSIEKGPTGPAAPAAPGSIKHGPTGPAAPAAPGQVKNGPETTGSSEAPEEKLGKIKSLLESIVDEDSDKTEKELFKEILDIVGVGYGSFFDDDAETTPASPTDPNDAAGGIPVPANPGGNPAPASPPPRRSARQTRPQPGTQSGGAPGGSGGGPGGPGTPPPTPPQPGGPTGPEPGRPAPRTPDRNTRQPKTLEEEERELEERLAKIREERNAPYAAKLDAYAELLAKEESKRADGGFRFSIMHWVGGPGKNRKRERRREALDEAGKALKKEVLAYLRQKVETKRQNGEYQGTDDEIAQQMSDEMFDEQRKIFGQRLQERKDEILRSESDKLRNRILAKIGSWIGMEKSTKNSLKAAAVGVGHGLVKGAAVGALTGLFGVTWPISVGVSIVAAAVGDRMIRRGVRLDAIRQGLGGQNGSRQLVDDDKFARIKEKAEGKKHSQEFMADKMLKLSRKDSYAAGDRLSKETDERIGKHKVALGIGRVAGGAVGGIGGRWVGQQLHDHTPVGQAVDSAKRNVHEFIHREDTAAAAVEREYQGKIDELNRRIEELNNRLEQATADRNIDNSGSFSNWEYPWDWAVDQFGENNAISKLYELADAAARDGHNIQWHGYGDTQWLSIDGNSDTATVLETLAKYMKDNYDLAA